VLDRAERSAGVIAAVKAMVARALAAEPEPPLAWSPPRGLAALDGLLDQVRAASSKTVGPANPAVKWTSGSGTYEYRATPANDWAQLAKLDLDVARVAWALASEAPSPISKYPQYAWAIAEAICNAGIAKVTHDSRILVDGHFGRQGGRWCASFQPPTWRHVKAAELVVARARAGEPNILAKRATQWTDQQTQDVIHVTALAKAAQAERDVAAAEKKGDAVALAAARKVLEAARKKAANNPAPEVVMRRRYSVGQKWIGPLVDVVGSVVIDPWVLTLLGPEGADQTHADAMLADGRRRWRRPV
jgi:hypothetical protein